MHQRPRRTTAALATLAAFAAGCSAAPDLAPKGIGTGNSGDGEVLNLTRPAEDASKLTIGDLYMSHMTIKGQATGSLYVTTSGAADNVEIAVCYDAEANGAILAHSGCDATRKETVTRLIFAPFPNAAVTIRARACVLPERATTPGVLCGPWKETIWNQPPNSNAALTELLVRREKYRAEIAEFAQAMKDVLVEFEKEADACNKRKQAGVNLGKVKNIVANFLQVGEMLISKSLEPGNMSPQGTTTPPAQNTEQPIPAVNTDGAVNNAANIAGNINTEADPGLAAPAATISMIPREANAPAAALTGSSPVGALQILGNAVIDLATASTQAESNRKCFAQQAAEGQLQTASARLKELGAKLKSVEAEIQAAGGAQ